MEPQLSLSFPSECVVRVLVTNNNTVRLPSKNRRKLWTTEIFQTLLIAHAHAGLREHQIVRHYLVNPLSLLREKTTENTGCKSFRPFRS
jgi:hypothetical protein